MWLPEGESWLLLMDILLPLRGIKWTEIESCQLLFSNISSNLKLRLFNVVAQLDHGAGLPSFFVYSKVFLKPVTLSQESDMEFWLFLIVTWRLSKAIRLHVISQEKLYRVCGTWFTPIHLLILVSVATSTYVLLSLELINMYILLIDYLYDDASCLIIFFLVNKTCMDWEPENCS